MDTLNRTDIHGNPVVERRHWSFSALDKFTNCARKFYHYDIAKTIKEPGEIYPARARARVRD